MQHTHTHTLNHSFRLIQTHPIIQLNQSFIQSTPNKCSPVAGDPISIAEPQPPLLLPAFVWLRVRAPLGKGEPISMAVADERPLTCAY